MASTTPNIAGAGAGAGDPGLADATASIRAIGEDLEPSAAGDQPTTAKDGDDD